jgi:hypothetical protein
VERGDGHLPHRQVVDISKRSGIPVHLLRTSGLPKFAKARKSKSARRKKSIMKSEIRRLTPKPSRSRSTNGPLVGRAIEAIEAEIEEYGRKLGFDVSRKGWLERASKEAEGYPLVIGGEKEEEAIFEADVLAYPRARPGLATD